MKALSNIINHPNAPSVISGFAPLGGQGDRRYTYDGNGNPTGYEEFKSFRMMVWDEENRLRGINDNGLLHLYTYDHTGERTLKSSSETSQTMINGATAAIITHNEDYTAYVSPYFVVQKGRFTKHYFEGASRISSKLGEGTFTQNGKGITAGGIDYLKQTGLLDEALRNYIKDLNTPPGPPTQQGIYASPEWTGQPYPSIDWEAITQNQEPPEGWPRPPKFNEPGDVPGPPVQFGDPITPETVEAGFNFVDNGIEEKNVYFYHPDHLGSSSHITDVNGDLSQHTEFMAFGEILFDEHSVSVTQPYLFNGKELDQETNLTYYGARYLDMKTSLWLSVDPLVEKTLQPYQYANNNPVRFIDSDGREAVDMAPPRTIFVNGYRMMGTLEGGQEYWSKSFIKGAISFGSKTLNDYAKMQTTFVNYNPSWYSSANKRITEGYEYAKNNYDLLTRGMNQKEDYFNIVDHSMGVAFGEGLSRYMQEMGWEVNKVVHINGFQAADIKVNKSQNQSIMISSKTQVIDYQNIDDPVINNPIRSSPGDIKNSTYKVREESGMSRDYKHASPISKGGKFWRDLPEKLKKVNSNE